MVEVGARDALQPALLDRLTDHDPGRKVEGRDERVLSRSQLRASVLRDLSWLFNSTNLASTVDLTAHPLAAQSTLNYGLTALAGNPVASLDLHEVERILKEAILRFEPRILPGSLSVRGIEAQDPRPVTAPGPDRMLDALEALARGDISVEEADRRLEVLHG